MVAEPRIPFFEVRVRPAEGAKPGGLSVIGGGSSRSRNHCYKVLEEVISDQQLNDLTLAERAQDYLVQELYVPVTSEGMAGPGGQPPTPTARP